MRLASSPGIFEPPIPHKSVLSTAQSMWLMLQTPLSSLREPHHQHTGQRHEKQAIDHQRGLGQRVIAFILAHSGGSPLQLSLRLQELLEYALHERLVVGMVARSGEVA